MRVSPLKSPVPGPNLKADGRGSVVVIGDVQPDFTFRLSRSEFTKGDGGPAVTGGGTAANVAAALARLDVAVSFVGSVGNDPFGRMVLDGELKSEKESISPGRCYLRVCRRLSCSRWFPRTARPAFTDGPRTTERTGRLSPSMWIWNAFAGHVGSTPAGFAFVIHRRAKPFSPRWPEREQQASSFRSI